MTSSYAKTVVSPGFGLKWAATWFKEHPVGNAIPDFKPLSGASFLLYYSSSSHMSISFLPGFIIL